MTNTPGAIINWQQFSIQKDEVTRFLQQNASSAVLNRVTTQNPSVILGSLTSNGRVFLINPNGIAFGQGAVINVAGLAASTLNISDADWHATLEINLMAAVRATRSALPAMIAAGKGAIVSTCSANAHLPDPAVMDYSAAKAALASFPRHCPKK